MRLLFFVAETVGNVSPKIHVVGMKWEVSLVERGCIRSGWTFESAGSQWGELEQWTQVGGGTDWSLSYFGIVQGIVGPGS